MGLVLVSGSDGFPIDLPDLHHTVQIFWVSPPSGVDNIVVFQCIFSKRVVRQVGLDGRRPRFAGTYVDCVEFDVSLIVIPCLILSIDRR